MRWKIWTEDAQAREAGGIYLFDTREHAQRYLDMHAASRSRRAQHPQPHLRRQRCAHGHQPGPVA